MKPNSLENHDQDLKIKMIIFTGIENIDFVNHLSKDKLLSISLQNNVGNEQVPSYHSAIKNDKWWNTAIPDE